MTPLAGLARHFDAAHAARPERVGFSLGQTLVGSVTPKAAHILETLGCARNTAGVGLGDAAALPALVARLAGCGQFGLRGEAFDVRAAPDTPPVATIDRGALPWFGIAAAGVHVNGLVRRPDGLHLWVARRAADKKLDPGKLDHLVAGGIPAGLTPMQTLIKEAAEEAGMAASLASQARPVGIVAYSMLRAEGLRRDHLHCYDLELPEDFVPVPHDGEVAGFALWPIGQVLRAVAETDDFKFNVNLVLIDLFQRLGLVGPLANPHAA